MQRIEVNVQTGEIKTIQFTPEEEAEILAYAATVQEPVPVKPTLEDLQAQLASIAAQIQELANA